MENEYTRYYHFRYAGPSGKLAVKSPKHGSLQFKPVGNPYSNGGITIAIRETDDNLYFGCAKCNLVDTYSKKHGRLMSSGRSRSSVALKTDKMDKDQMIQTAVKIAKLLDDNYTIEGALNLID